MKKISALWVMLISSLSFVSAQYGGGYVGDPISGVNKGIQQIIFFIEALLGPVATILLGGDGTLLFERVLFLAVVFSIVYVVIKNLEPFKDRDKRAVVWIITIAVSLLATRFLADSAIVQTIILPYSVLGITITAILPLIIYFAFVESFDNSIIRKVLWIFFMVVFIGLWGSRIQDLGSLSWIYFWTAILALVFLLFDGTIQRSMMKQRHGQLDHDRRMRIIADINSKLEKLEEQRTKGQFTDTKAYKRIKKNLLKQIKDLSKAH